MTCKLLTAVAMEIGAPLNSCKQAFPATTIWRPSESELIKAAKTSNACLCTERHAPQEGPLSSVKTQELEQDPRSPSQRSLSYTHSSLSPCCSALGAPF